MAKKNITEGFFDTALKGLAGVYFGGKFTRDIAATKALKDPKVKKSFQKVAGELKKFDDLIKKKYGEDHKGSSLT
tara:strand:+ start:856 stop:1080 length:225 start_codon:yes stop_codon:yes gene_type:complete